MVTRMVAVITQRDMPKDAKRHQNREKKKMAAYAPTTGLFPTIRLVS
jgi:hypothetical protein